MTPLRLAHVLLFCVGVLSQTPIRVDDTYVFSQSSPGGIQFGGAGWDNYNPGHAAERYNGSYTVTNTPDATIVLFFRGKLIKYYGDKDPKGGSTSVRVDGQAAATVGVAAPPSGFLFQQLLWASPPLDANDHQLVISNVGAKVNPQQGVMGLDFFEIVPNDGTNSVAPSSFGPGASSVSENAVLVDDSGGSVTYTGNWRTKNSVPDSSIYFRGSAHTTQTPGDSCTFRFIGTDIWYFTDYAPGNAVVGISVDGGAPENVNTAAASPALSRTQWVAWSKTGLSDAPHTITITHAGSPGSAASLDFFKYVASSGAGANSGSASATAAASTDSSTSGGTSKSAPVGAIVGGSVGGFAVLAAITFVALLLVRKRAKDHQPPSPPNNGKESASWMSPPMSPHPSMLVYGASGTNSQSYGQYPVSGASSGQRQSIVYYGDKDPAGGTATVRIDGQQYTNVSVGATVFSAQQALWTSPALDLGDHQVVISNIGARVNLKKPVVGLDFFEIVPSDASGDVAPLELGPGASSVPENAILVENTDPSISYGGNGWQPKPSTPDGTIYLGGSAHSTRFPAESCIFRFSGTAVWYFTDYAMGNAVVVISVDGGPVETVNTTAPSQALSRSQRMSWSKTGLSDGLHTVMITHADWAGTWATVDFFMYLPSSGTAASSTTARSSTLSESATPSRSATAAASTNLNTSNSDSNPALGGAVAGSVIGGVVGLTLLALVILAVIRTRRKRNLHGSRAKLTGEPSWNSLPTSGWPSAVGHGSSDAHAPSYYPNRGPPRVARGHSGRREVPS